MSEIGYRELQKQSSPEDYTYLIEGRTQESAIKKGHKLAKKQRGHNCRLLSSFRREK